MRSNTSKANHVISKPVLKLVLPRQMWGGGPTMNRLFFFLLLACLHVSALSISGDPPRHQDAGLPIEVVMKGWEKEVRTRVENDKKFKPYLAKNSLVVLHSGLLFRDRRNAGESGRSGFDFAEEKAYFNHLEFCA